MDGLMVFLASSSGQLLCKAFIAVGFFDFIICYLVFDKTIKKMEKNIVPGMVPNEEGIILTRLKNQRLVKSYIIFLACAFIVFGVFGLTR